MSHLTYMEKLLDGVEVEWKALGGLVENLDSMRKPITSGLRESGSIPYYGASGIVDYVKDYIFDGDFLLVSEDGANLLARNTPIAFSISGKSWVNNHAHILKFNTYAERRFVDIYLNSIDLTPYISGAAQPKLNQKNLNSIPIPIPCPDNPEKSLAIQAEIVRILDAFTELTAELTAELNMRKKQYNYYRDQLLSFEEGEVEWKTLGEITRISSASRVHKNEWTTSGVPFFRTSDVISLFNRVKNTREDAFISNELYEKLSLKSGKLQKDDILVTGGGTIGIPYVVPTDEPLYFKDADLLCIKKSKQLNSKFLYHYFLTTKFRVYS